MHHLLYPNLNLIASRVRWRCRLSTPAHVSSNKSVDAHHHAQADDEVRKLDVRLWLHFVSTEHGDCEKT